MRNTVVLAFLLTCVSTANARSGDLVGQASVIDGDTIEIHGERIRLFGIDAPESMQTCELQGKSYSCGKKAALALADRIGRESVACHGRDRDRYGRTVAVCTVGGEDLGAWLVSAGWALAYRKYSLNYVDEEAVAQTSKAGLWAGKFMPPWEYRHAGNHVGEAGSGIPGQCLIKGNISQTGNASTTFPANSITIGQASTHPKASDGFVAKRKPLRRAGGGHTNNENCYPMGELGAFERCIIILGESSQE